VTIDEATVEPVSRRTAAALASRWRLLAVSVLIASAAVLTTLYLTQYRVDRQTGAAAEEAAVAAASSATAALLSYAPETIGTDLSTAQSLMTGDFSTYYGKFTAEVVAPAVRDRGVKAQAHVIDSALMELQPDQAKVLVFLKQETASHERPEPAVTASSVVVTVTKVDGAWLISAFDPV
jgi:Mce-associated membrane protein